MAATAVSGQSLHRGRQISLRPVTVERAARRRGGAEVSGVPRGRIPGRGPFAAILGKDELAAGEVTLKHLQSGEQKHVPLAQVAGTMSGMG